MVKYLKRYADKELEFYLESIGGILIVGPKWCGKTTTAKQFAKSILELQDKNKLSTYQKWAEFDPSELLNGEKPRLIDEWQELPELWDIIRYDIDKSNMDGAYILTGSTVVDENKILHSGAGRIHRLIMRPMSLYESGESNGKISIEDLFNNPELNINGIESSLTVKDLIFASCRGGWPASLTKKSDKSKLSVVYSYLDIIINTDASNIDGVGRNPLRVEAILQSYARNISTSVKDKTIINDVKSRFGDISAPTFYSYISALKRLFVIDDIQAWSPNIRSKTAIRTTMKKEFIDPSIAVAALGLNPTALENDLNTFGFIFENLCIRDLKVYTDHLNAKVLYYRDRYDLEVDCVLHLRDGRYALIEFKLGSREEEKGAKNLLKLKSIIKNKKEKNDNIQEPTFLAIVTGGNMAYTRKDGVKVIPIGCLK